MTLAAGQTVGRLGPGLMAALLVLGPAGVRIARAWSAIGADGLAEMERSLPWGAHPRAAGAAYDETRLGSRRLGYGRWGLACALLRRAGMVSRTGRADRQA